MADPMPLPLLTGSLGEYCLLKSVVDFFSLLELPLTRLGLLLPAETFIRFGLENLLSGDKELSLLLY